MSVPFVRVDASGTRLVIDTDVREIARCERCGSARFASRVLVDNELNCSATTACTACGLVRRCDERGLPSEPPARRSPVELPLSTGWRVPA